MADDHEQRPFNRVIMFALGQHVVSVALKLGDLCQVIGFKWIAEQQCRTRGLLGSVFMFRCLGPA